MRSLGFGSGTDQMFCSERLRVRTAIRSAGKAADHKADDQEPTKKATSKNPPPYRSSSHGESAEQTEKPSCSQAHLAASSMPHLYALAGFSIAAYGSSKRTVLDNQVGVS
jgi:hypothetical protein